MNKESVRTGLSENKCLTDAFDFIRKNYFPRWDKNQTWSVKLTKYLPGQGLCDCETKTIQIQHVPGDENDLHLLLIHEICHAVTNSVHKKRWFARMYEAARRAKQMGNERLEQMLQKQVDEYIDPDKSFVVNAAYIYGTISDFVSEDPEATYEQVLAAVVRDIGCSLQELEKNYVRCKRVYEKKKHEVMLRQKKTNNS